jgi:hypothetical protein
MHPFMFIFTIAAAQSTRLQTLTRTPTSVPLSLRQRQQVVLTGKTSYKLQQSWPLRTRRLQRQGPLRWESDGFSRSAHTHSQLDLSIRELTFIPQDTVGELAYLGPESALESIVIVLTVLAKKVRRGGRSTSSKDISRLTELHCELREYQQC